MSGLSTSKPSWQLCGQSLLSTCSHQFLKDASQESLTYQTCVIELLCLVHVVFAFCSFESRAGIQGGPLKEDPMALML